MKSLDISSTLAENFIRTQIDNHLTDAISNGDHIAYEIRRPIAMSEWGPVKGNFTYIIVTIEHKRETC